MVYPPQLTIQLRKKQLISIIPDTTYGFNVIFVGSNPMSLSAVAGNEDTTWHDYTDYVDGLRDISLSWSTTQTTTGEVPNGQFVPKKGVSGTLTFERDAKDFIKAHLVDNVAATHNEIEVQITDLATGVYSGYVVKSADLSWCEFNALCVFELNLKQADLPVQCIERTMIADNYRGWFQNEPLDSYTGLQKFHPRFSYCTERRPNGVLILEWIGMAMLAVITGIIFSALFPILATIYVILAVINTIIDAINTLPGISIPNIPNPTPISPSGILDGWTNLMLEAAGCGREHPAPLIRDYITNVCDKCGIGVDANTADIFFATFLPITSSDGVLSSLPNPHYNACYFFPAVERGVRRFRSWNLLTGNSTPDSTTYYQPSNQPVLALSDMLDQLKKVYNARWQVRNAINGLGQSVPYLFFKRKDAWKNDVAIYDFSYGGADRSKIVEGICYQQSEYTVPASMSGLYADDPSDKCGHEAARQYNGDPLSFNNTIVDPHFNGILDKLTDFAPAKFNLDGTTGNYLYDALQTCWSSIALTALVTAIIYDNLGTFIQEYTDFALQLQTETVTKPKILIWNGKQFLNARALTDEIMINGVPFTLGHAAQTGISGWPAPPTPNTLFPLQAATSGSVLTTLAAPSTTPALPPFNQWDYAYPPQSGVIGRIGGSAPPSGVYQVMDYLGTVRAQNPAVLVNWPMYFTPYFKGSMWDMFHWIDSPYNNPQLHKKWSLKIPLCKEDIEKLGLTSDGGEVKLLSAVTLDTPFYDSGVITDIIVDYGNGDSTNGSPVTGQTIELKGYV